MQVPVPSAAEVERTLAAVLARPEFAPPPRRPFFGAVVAALQWLGARIAAFLGWLFPDFDGSDPAWSVAGRIGLLVLIVVALALVGRVAYRTFVRLRRDGRGGPRAPAGPAGPSGPHTGEEWEAEARALAGQGRWREAAVALYHAVLQRLAAIEAVRLDAAKTPGDYRRELRGRPGLEEPMTAFVRRFETVALGRTPPDRAAWEALDSLAAAVQVRG